MIPLIATISKNWSGEHHRVGVMIISRPTQHAGRIPDSPGAMGRGANSQHGLVLNVTPFGEFIGEFASGLPLKFASA